MNPFEDLGTTYCCAFSSTKGLLWVSNELSLYLVSRAGVVSHRSIRVCDMTRAEIYDRIWYMCMSVYTESEDAVIAASTTWRQFRKYVDAIQNHHLSNIDSRGEILLRRLPYGVGFVTRSGDQLVVFEEVHRLDREVAEMVEQHVRYRFRDLALGTFLLSVLYHSILDNSHRIYLGIVNTRNGDFATVMGNELSCLGISPSIRP